MTSSVVIRRSGFSFSLGKLLVRTFLLWIYLIVRNDGVVVVSWSTTPTSSFLPFSSQIVRRISRLKAADTISNEKNGVSLEQKPKDTSVAPVIITIGPPCCGKTWALRQFLEREGYHPYEVLSSQDVALDEQSDVYHRVPLEAFIYPSTRLDPELGAHLLKSGFTLKERLLRPSPSPLDSTDAELRNIILRVAGRITAQDFADRTRELALQAGDTVKFFRKRRQAVAEDLIKAVETVSAQAVGEVLFQREFSSEKELSREEEEELPYEDGASQQSQEGTLSAVNELPANVTATSAHLLSARALIRTPHVDLFVPHAIFLGGIETAEQKLMDLLTSSPRNAPIVWGNTNTRPMEYAAALAAAQRARRPVHFIAWGTPQLPRVPRGELLRSNVERFRTTGRYIPAGAVGAALGRVERLVKEAEKQQTKLVTPSSSSENASDPTDQIDRNELSNNHQMNVAFAGLAGYLMNEEGLVAKIGEPKDLSSKKSHKYTKHGRNASNRKKRNR